MVIHHPASQRPPHPTAWGTATGMQGEEGVIMGEREREKARGETAWVGFGGDGGESEGPSRKLREIRGLRRELDMGEGGKERQMG